MLIFQGALRTLFLLPTSYDSGAVEFEQSADYDKIMRVI